MTLGIVWSNHIFIFGMLPVLSALV